MRVEGNYLLINTSSGLFIFCIPSKVFAIPLDPPLLLYKGVLYENLTKHNNIIWLLTLFIAFIFGRVLGSPFSSGAIKVK